MIYGLKYWYITPEELEMGVMSINLKHFYNII